MTYPDGIDALVNVNATDSLAAGGHAARHNSVNVALEEVRDYLNVQLPSKADLLVGVTNTSASVYSLSVSDSGKLVTVSASAGSASVEIPTDSSGSFSNGTAIGVAWLGAASAVRITAASGVTLNSTSGSGSPAPLNKRYAAAQLYKTGTNTWIAIGNLL